MRFAIEQRIAAPPHAIAAALADPAFYGALVGMAKIGPPEVLRHEVDGNTVRLAVRYRFTGKLSAAARAVVDPAKLTWVEDGVHDLTAAAATYTMEADHYADRFRCSATDRSVAEGSGSVRRVEGDLSIRIPLVSRAVEGAIVSGLEEHFEAESPILERWIAGRPPAG